MNQNSYTAASTLPAKLLRDTETVKKVKGGYIPPVHVQINPTNVCNLHCGFCSCSKRDRAQIVDFDRIAIAMREFAGLGTKSVTITGGGEPLLYPEISDLVHYIAVNLKIEVGLVTNGTVMERLSSYRNVKWCRISSSDDREPAWDGIEAAVREYPTVDWAFSHVVTAEPSWKTIEKVVNFANDHAFTHVRLVADLLDLDKAAGLVKTVRNYLRNWCCDDRLVIYQGRQDYLQGSKKCLISLLKPVVGADGGIYPCCGVQYAREPKDNDYPRDMMMGHLEDISEIWGNQQYFDGSICQVCYYDPYNLALGLISTPTAHGKFV